MVNESHRREELFGILDSLSSEEYLGTADISRKIGCQWITTLNKLFYLEFRGYVKFAEIKTRKKGGTKISYAWKKLREGEKKNQSISSSFEYLLEFLPVDRFISTNELARMIGENNQLLKAKLLYLESRKEITSFKIGKRNGIRRYYHWKRLTEEEKESMKDYDVEEIAKRYQRECFRYN